KREEDVVNACGIDAVALNDADLVVQHVVALLIQAEAKGLAERLDDFQHGDLGVAGVWSDDEHAITLEDSLLQFSPPELFARIPDVIAVTDAGDQAGRVLVEHVPEGVYFVLAAPTGNGGMLA